MKRPAERHHARLVPEEGMFHRRTILAVGAALLAAPLSIPFAGWTSPAKSGELTVLIWPEYLDAGVVRDFEERHGVTIRQIPYDSEQQRDQLLLKKGADAFDLVVVNRLNLAAYARRKWLTPLEPARLQHLDRLDRRWLSEPDETGKWLGLPYFWGNVGLAWRADKLAAAPTGWMDFFRPGAALRGRIQAMDSAREMVGLALMALGHSVNAEEESALAGAEALLMAQKPFVRNYRYIDLSPASPLVTGDVWMAMVFNGDALKLREFHPQINYVQPREGSLLWLDDLALGGRQSGRELAVAFLEHLLLDPVIAARNAESLHFASPNHEALPLTSIAYREDPIVFPSEEELRRSEMVRPVAARAQRRINDIMARLLK
ncbi:MAG: spermidine/putrescine ABC transporter substrate-binding protein [Magnetococcales bacterium]|nr:spermidine/putrescine ABC transporter substrate-binding protein [Magnetococcales bacterium]MBF0148600.1 spermidine/putrescine ABC transporter substrate-binding protein [Magnetococcales bacterium]